MDGTAIRVLEAQVRQPDKHASRNLYKVLLEGDDLPKSLQEHKDA